MDFPRFGAFNKSQTFTSSGTFVAPVSGTYKITLQGGGGGGGGAGSLTTSTHAAGGGGGEGANLVFYETLTAGTSYAYTIGGGGTGGTKGSASASGANGNTGGATEIVIGTHNYSANGGQPGSGSSNSATQSGGLGGIAKIDDVSVGRGAPGEAGLYQSGSLSVLGGNGGGNGGAIGVTNTRKDGTFGGGGAGGPLIGTTYYDGGNGGNGYITIEYCDV